MPDVCKCLDCHGQTSKQHSCALWTCAWQVLVHSGKRVDKMANARRTPACTTSHSLHHHCLPHVCYHCLASAGSTTWAGMPCTFHTTCSHMAALYTHTHTACLSQVKCILVTHTLTAWCAHAHVPHVHPGSLTLCACSPGWLPLAATQSDPIGRHPQASSYHGPAPLKVLKVMKVLRMLNVHRHNTQQGQSSTPHMQIRARASS